MKKILIIVLFAIGVLSAQAQETAEFTADRPGASTGPSVVGQGVVQLDVAADINLKNPSKFWSVSCGLAWQINK